MPILVPIGDNRLNHSLRRPFKTSEIGCMSWPLLIETQRFCGPPNGAEEQAPLRAEDHIVQRLHFDSVTLCAAGAAHVTGRLAKRQGFKQK